MRYRSYKIFFSATKYIFRKNHKSVQRSVIRYIQITLTYSAAPFLALIRSTFMLHTNSCYIWTNITYNNNLLEINILQLLHTFSD